MTLVQSQCNTANRDHKWYKDAYDLIIQVNEFAQKTKSKHDQGIAGILLNCIVVNKNTAIDREKRNSEWRKLGMILHPDRIGAGNIKKFMEKTDYSKEQMHALSQIYTDL